MRPARLVGWSGELLHGYGPHCEKGEGEGEADRCGILIVNANGKGKAKHDEYIC